MENDLVTVCTLLCLDYTGRKADLIGRIIDGLRNLQVIKEAAQREEDEERDDDDNNEAEDDDHEVEEDREDNEDARRFRGQDRRTGYQFAFHFKDIENAVR